MENQNRNNNVYNVDYEYDDVPQNNSFAKEKAKKHRKNDTRRMMNQLKYYDDSEFDEDEFEEYEYEKISRK
jgi:hypothetical protein